jgi:hypothetical protein
VLRGNGRSLPPDAPSSSLRAKRAKFTFREAGISLPPHEHHSIMKTLNSYGQYSIQPNRSHRPHRALHDGWPDHAAFPPTYGVINGLSGNFFLYLATLLKDGNAYFWISDSGMEQDAALALIASYVAWPVQGLPGTYFGEGFNAAMRPQLTTKILQSQLSAWQAAN